MQPIGQIVSPLLRSQAITQRVRQLVAHKLGIAEDRLSARDNLTLDLGADDLDRVELVMALERTFEIRIPNEVFADLQTLADVTRYVVASSARLS